MRKGDTKIHLVAAGLILNKDKTKVLLIKRSDKFWGDKWSFPGGHIELHEHSTETIRRELKEELDLKIISTELLEVQEIVKNNFHLVSFIYIVIAEDYFKTGDKEFDDVEWINVSEIDNTPCQLSDKIREYLKSL
ncbi:MAG: NUDIX hydrolase [archaeon]